MKVPDDVIYADMTPEQQLQVQWWIKLDLNVEIHNLYPGRWEPWSKQTHIHPRIPLSWYYRLKP